MVALVLFVGMMGAASARPGVSADDLYILEVRLGRYVLSSAAIGYVTDGELCVVLDDLVTALDFAIERNGNRYEGWLVKEANRFLLDLDTDTLAISGEDVVIGPTDILDDGGSPCVSLKAASTWFPADFTADLANSLVLVESRQTLPVEARAARAKRQAALNDSPDALGEVDPSDIIFVPYRMMSLPHVDVVTTATMTEDRTEATIDAVISGDLVGFESSALIAVNSDRGVLGVRGSMRRMDADGVMPGMASVKTLEIGDVSSLASSVMATSRAGRGISLSNQRRAATGFFDQQIIRGDLPEGWEAELYLNGALIAHQSSRDDRRYEFENVPVRNGVNRIVVKLYGPQGQIREERRELFVGNERLPKGEALISAIALQEDIPTFYSARLTSRPETGQWRIGARAAYGVSKDVTITSEMTSYMNGSERNNYLSAGFSSSFLGAGLAASTILSSEGGRALVANIYRQFSLTQVGVSFESFDDFRSEIISGGKSGVEQRAMININSMLSTPAWRLPLSMEARHTMLKDGTSAVDAVGRTSMRVGRANLANEISFRSRTAPGGAAVSETSGTALLSTISPIGSVRASIDYDVVPEAALTRISASADLPITDSVGLSVDIGHEIDTEQTTVSTGFNLDRDQFRFGAQAQIDGEGHVSANFSMAISFVPISASRIVSTQDRTARSGAALVRPFVDTDGNGILSGDEMVLSGTGVKLDGRRLSGRPSAGNGLLLTGLSTEDLSRIGLDMASVEDPYLVAAGEPVRYLQARPATLAIVDLPLVRSGEIVGTVSSDREGGALPLGDVTLQLVQADGRVVAETTSEFDGFFVFESVAYGEYTLRVSPEQAARLGLSAEKIPALTLSKRQDIIEGIDVAVTLKDQ